MTTTLSDYHYPDVYEQTLGHQEVHTGETASMTEMRVLTVRQPWAWAIMHGSKNIENRVRNIAGDYRGPIAIHAAKSGDTGALSDTAFVSELMKHTSVDDLANGADRQPWRYSELPRGVILGVVELTDVHPAGNQYEPIAPGVHQIDLTKQSCCPPWGQRNQHHLVLENPRPLVQPIPYRGALGMRRLDEQITKQILAQIFAR